MDDAAEYITEEMLILWETNFPLALGPGFENSSVSKLKYQGNRKSKTVKPKSKELFTSAARCSFLASLLSPNCLKLAAYSFVNASIPTTFFNSCKTSWHNILKSLSKNIADQS